MSDKDPNEGKGFWKFSDGHCGWMSDLEAAEYTEKEQTRRTYFYRKYSDAKPNHRPVTRDGTGFKPHFNQGIGAWIETRRQYRDELKRRNLTEVGNEKIGAQTTPKPKNYLTDEVVNEVRQMGHSFTDSEVKEMRDIKNG